MRSLRGMRCLVGTALLAVAAFAEVAAAQPLRRNLGSYALLALRRASLKDISVGGACNVGVNCASTKPGADCGILRLDGALFADGSQTVGDQVFFSKPGAIVFQLFRNGGGALDEVTINQPPVQSFATPIIPGTCSATCEPNFAAFEALCGFPTPFPACDPARSVTVERDRDCTGDIAPGNGHCDLGPGAYGEIEVRNGATLELAPGVYTPCDFKVSRKARVFADGVTINVPDGGSFQVNNGSQVGQDCDGLVVRVQGAGPVNFGRNARIAGTVCAPRATVRLGHNNVLVGQFVGETLTADFHNEVQCCGGRCACFDRFAPTTAAAGTNVTLFTHCDFGPVTAVRICGLAATIVTRTNDEMVVTVPAGATGACVVEVDSAAGNFMHDQPLTVP